MYTYNTFMYTKTCGRTDGDFQYVYTAVHRVKINQPASKYTHVWTYTVIIYSVITYCKIKNLKILS